MFRHHTENSPSTGEPPTPPLPPQSESRLTPSSHQTSVGQWSSGSRSFFETSSSSIVDPAERGRSNTIPSQDSGYEMSPNLNPSDTQEFFTESEVFEDSNARDSDDELCSECGDDFCQCPHSSRTTVRAPRTPSNVYCDMYSSFSSYQRPSSLPIEIPRGPSTLLPSSSFSSSSQRRQRHSSHSLPAITTSPHMPIFEQFLHRSQPRLWPHMIPINRQNTHHLSVVVHQRISLPFSRSRLSDSSLSSSIESFFDLEPLDGVRDDVFQDAFYEMAEEDVSFHPTTDYRRRLNSEAASQPLPDLLLHASPRRSRSASVNLPPDHAVLRDIGRSLRRISDDFQTRLSGQQQSNDRASLNNNRPVFKFFKKV